MQALNDLAGRRHALTPAAKQDSEPERPRLNQPSNQLAEEHHVLRRWPQVH